MSVLVSNVTPYVIWRVDGGLVGACRTLNEALDLVRDLKRTFPDRDYICRDVDGDLRGDSRTMALNIHDQTEPK